MTPRKATAEDAEIAELFTLKDKSLRSPRSLRLLFCRRLWSRRAGTAWHNRRFMATLYPFRALRPAPDTAAAIAAVPYDVVSTDEARALADGNPLSFLRVSRAEIELPPG